MVVTMNTDPFGLVHVRNTVSGITETLSPDQADILLAHPWFGQFHEEVDSDKDYPLTSPYKLDEDGNRHPFTEFDEPTVLGGASVAPEGAQLADSPADVQPDLNDAPAPEETN